MMQVDFVRLSSDEAPVLPRGDSLMLNVNDRIITLLKPGRIYAQCRLSPGAFRLFFLLLRAPRGADYAELLACLHCSEAVFDKLLMASSYERILEVLAPQIQRWNTHLEHTGRQSKVLLEKELKIIRRVAKERNGVNTVLLKAGFAMTVKAMYRKGYLLTYAAA
jgi:hypothetical protein